MAYWFWSQSHATVGIFLNKNQFCLTSQWEAFQEFRSDETYISIKNLKQNTQQYFNQTACLFIFGKLIFSYHVNMHAPWNESGAILGHISIV